MLGTGMARRRPDLRRAALVSSGVWRRYGDGRHSALGKPRRSHRRVRMGFTTRTSLRRQCADGRRLLRGRLVDDGLWLGERLRGDAAGSARLGRCLRRLERHQQRVCLWRRCQGRHPDGHQSRGEFAWAGSGPQRGGMARDDSRAAERLSDLWRHWPLGHTPRATAANNACERARRSCPVAQALDAERAQHGVLRHSAGSGWGVYRPPFRPCWPI